MTATTELPLNHVPGDVIRILSFDELPQKVKRIPHDLNPIADGVLMAHQRDFIADPNPLKLVEKGRRTGITFSIALDKTIKCATSKEAGGDDIYYVGDTKEKGLEFIGYCAHFAKVMASAMADGFLGIEVFLFEDEQKDGTSKFINAYRIRFASGFQIVALSSNPANIRGLQGDVVIDEAAFHRDVQGVIDSANALLIWGSGITIISTHNGESNPFNQLIRETLAGVYPYKLFKYTFDDAVANGLFEIVCMMKSWEATEENKRTWYNRIRSVYGQNYDTMHEELDAIPKEGSGVAIPSVQIEACMKEKRPVIKWELKADWVLQPKDKRKKLCEAWIKENIDPLLSQLNPDHTHFFGSDYARHRDLSIITPYSVDDVLNRKVPFIVELAKVPIRQQEQILFHIIKNLPRFRGGAMDATGSGEGLAERTADEFGHELIEQIKLTESWYRTNMGEFQKAFQERTIDLPRDKNTKNDIGMLRTINGIIKMPALRMKDVKNPEQYRHGDCAIALALGHYATFKEGAPAAGATVEEQNHEETYKPSNMKNRMSVAGLLGRVFNR